MEMTANSRESILPQIFSDATFDPVKTAGIPLPDWRIYPNTVNKQASALKAIVVICFQSLEIDFRAANLKQLDYHCLNEYNNRKML